VAFHDEWSIARGVIRHGSWRGPPAKARLWRGIVAGRCPAPDAPLQMQSGVVAIRAGHEV
jgi:hypothetical protein